MSTDPMYENLRAAAQAGADAHEQARRAELLAATEAIEQADRDDANARERARRAEGAHGTRQAAVNVVAEAFHRDRSPMTAQHVRALRGDAEIAVDALIDADWLPDLPAVDPGA